MAFALRLKNVAFDSTLPASFADRRDMDDSPNPSSALRKQSGDRIVE